MIPLLLAMQASGMIIDYFGTHNQAKMSEYGAKLTQAGINANVSQTRLEAEDASLQAMKNLRQTLGTQIAVMAARGTSTSGGSAVGLLNESVSNFNADERVRRLNQMGKENQLRAGKVSSMLTSQSENAKLWKGFASRTINRFPSSASGWQELGKSVSEGFGLSSIGS